MRTRELEDAGEDAAPCCSSEKLRTRTKSAGVSAARSAWSLQGFSDQKGTDGALNGLRSRFSGVRTDRIE